MLQNVFKETIHEDIIIQLNQMTSHIYCGGWMVCRLPEECLLPCIKSEEIRHHVLYFFNWLRQLEN